MEKRGIRGCSIADPFRQTHPNRSTVCADIDEECVLVFHDVFHHVLVFNNIDGR